MQIKLPYDIIENTVWKLMNSIKGDSLDDMLVILDGIDDYLKTVGWTQEEFDEETLRRVNSGWDYFF
jgi:hypothetical protein